MASTAEWVKNPAKWRERMRRWHRQIMDELLCYYGGNPPQCACCGEKEREFLQLDHINGNGAAERREVNGGKYRTGDKYYRWLRRNKPTGIQVLCANCNWGKMRLGYCPHTAPKGGMSIN